MGLPDYIAEPLAALQLPETLDRLRAASLFLSQVSPTEADWKNRAYFRAGLSEFRSVPQALHWDLGRRQVHSPERSRNPLVHLVLRLRRLAVYVANARTSESEVKAEFEFRDVKTTADIKILLIEDVRGYLSRERLDGYRAEDVGRLCDWFEENQREYGASFVLDIGVMQYCQELVEVYRDRTAETNAESRVE